MLLGFICIIVNTTNVNIIIVNTESQKWKRYVIQYVIVMFIIQYQFKSSYRFKYFRITNTIVINS